MSNQPSLWTEKYRPQTIASCILPARTKKQLHELISQGEIPSLLFTGKAGTGKTTAAKAICNELECDFLMINGSEESGIDTLRNKVISFASTTSIMSSAKHKVVILDEADHMTPNAQAALRGIIEQFYKNCRFIFTCNFKEKIIQPLHSRCSVVEFEIPREERKELLAHAMKRVAQILKSNSIAFEPEVIAKFVNIHFPDLRRVLNELQRYSAAGEIDRGILMNTSEEAVEEVLTFLRSKKFKDMRKWVDANSSIDASSLFDKLYDVLLEEAEPKSIPDAILILDEYQDKATRVLNPRINLAACLTQLMMMVSFK